MTRIALYGHGFKDNIFCGRNTVEQDRDGGIFNVERAIRKNECRIYPSIGNTAEIKIDPFTHYITSTAEWNNCKANIIGEEVTHAHVAYANKLDNLEELIDYLYPRTNTISVDISEYLEREEIYKINRVIDKIDYFFCAFDQIWSYINNPDSIIDDIHEKSIIHSKNAITYRKCGELQSIHPTILDGVNTLGAGDMLAGFFIDNLVTGKSREKSLRLAEKEVHEWLKTRKLTS